jgi:Flp pilus assembly protein TadB
MLIATIAALCTLLFFLLFASFRFGLEVVWTRFARKKRLSSRRESEWSRGALVRWSSFRRPYEHLTDLLTAVRWTVRPGSFVSGSLFLAGIGLSGGIVLFQSLRSAALLGFMLGSVPYLLLRMRLVNRQMATRLEFLPAVELFYQCYLVTGCRHVRTALQKTVEERRLPGEVHAVFDQLCRHLSVKGDDEESIRIFSLAFGHMWADYFGSILKVALSEGNNVSDNLKELIGDMRKAQLANQQDRHRLLEIRLANFTPVLFLALFLGINFRMNPQGSYQYYVVDPGGRGMLLNALALLFGSLIMGLYLSRKKM